VPSVLFDSLSREVRELKPGQPDGVFRFYNCGPTVYGPAHIGNFRTFLVNDVVPPPARTRVSGKGKACRNLTDVDDRTIAQVSEREAPLAKSPGNGRKYSTPTASRSTACRRMSNRRRLAISAAGDMIDVLLRKGTLTAPPMGRFTSRSARFQSTARFRASRSGSSSHQQRLLTPTIRTTWATLLFGRPISRRKTAM